MICNGPAAPTRLERLERASSRLGIDLRIKRDDLLPFPGGGNKIRIVAEWMGQARAEGCDAIVTNGGLNSNLARVVAQACAIQQIKCAVVLHGDVRAAERNPNVLAVRRFGAVVSIVEASAIAQALETAKAALRKEGRVPLVIPGGGYGLAGGRAHFAAAKEAHTQFEQSSWYPEYVIHASGTGTTQAGLVAGFGSSGTRVRTLGISVARPAERGRIAVEQLVDSLCSWGDVREIPRVEFYDQWTCGGYERSNELVLGAIEYFARLEGILFDETYTGKAALALLDMVKEGSIRSGSRVLFWHTGGLLNLWNSRKQ